MNVPRHRLNAQTSTPVSRVLPDSASRTEPNGQHRATVRSAWTTKMKVSAVAAFAGAVGLTVGGTAHAMAQPAPQKPALPVNLTLPPQLDDLARNILPPHTFVPGPGRAVAPVSGTVTSGYGHRWGTNHNGVDIANKIGTPVYAVTDGVVLESGPASGFGQWIRVRQDDGTTGVFGHVDKSFVHAGQHVSAGQQIGTVGNRGESTGPHLHYEVWDKNDNKINPQVWLNKRNVHP
ncbi:M23 family metallopeptidase [Gordonia sp. CPCC 206044]|uniref:M23 family metallopeptidase n=1 Tax=Gordonia sp. CPCC 206044 TaxID=3140793 RepID=UPI003AF3B32C